MGWEINLMRKYPRSKRDVSGRAAARTEEHKKIARRFDRDFFDGDRDTGYGGFTYQPRFWQPVIPDLKKFYDLSAASRVLDVGCAKGFMLHDMRELIPGIEVAGIDISEYAIENAMEDVRPFLQVGTATELPYEDDSFDLVVSVTTVHNLERDQCARSLQEIERVSRGGKFITVDAYQNEVDRERMDAWNLTALTYMHADEWAEFFREVGYTGDYYWFIP